MPWVTLDCRPSGLPIASASSPTFTCEESANVAGCRFAPCTSITARSPCANAPESVASCLPPSDVVTVNVRALPTT